MAHFAKISEENKVLQVVVVDNKNIVDSNGIEQESIGQSFLEKTFNWPAHLWIQASYHTSENRHRNGGNAIHGNFPGLGWDWDPINQIFIAPKPFDSWILNTSKAKWQSPIGDAPALSETEKNTHCYMWNEVNQNWEKIENNRSLTS
jgi:hypothetical protein